MDGVPTLRNVRLPSGPGLTVVKVFIPEPRLGNKYFNDSQPWATRKSDIAQCGNTIHVSLQICASLAVLFEPFIPFSAQALREMLRLNGVRSYSIQAKHLPQRLSGKRDKGFKEDRKACANL